MGLKVGDKKAVGVKVQSAAAANKQPSMSRDKASPAKAQVARAVPDKVAAGLDFPALTSSTPVIQTSWQWASRK